MISRLPPERIAVIAKLKVAPYRGVEHALGSFQTHRFLVGREVFQLDRAGMTHILERHHPQFWDGSVKVQQSFFDPAFTVEDITEAIDGIMKQNRDKLMEFGGGRGQLTATWRGRTYMLGVNEGRIGQFYPVE